MMRYQQKTHTNKVPKEIIESPGPKRKHEESELHLKFCKWVRKTYPEDLFIRHEREQQRSKFMGNLMKVYNSEIDMPDFEALVLSGMFTLLGSHDWYSGLYIEFKKPGTILTLRDGITIKPQYLNQYMAHKRLWGIGRPAYFCSDFEQAKNIYESYKSGNRLPMQKFSLPLDKNTDEFFNERGL